MLGMLWSITIIDIIFIFNSMVLLRILTAVQPMTEIEGLKYQASDG